MAFDKYKNGAWMEPEEAVRRYENGAWVDCESAKRYVDGAWGEVWSATTITCSFNDATKNNTTTTYSYEILNNGKAMNYSIVNPSWTDGYSYIRFYIRNNEGFEGTLKVKYTLSQSVTNNQCALRIANSIGSALSNDTTFNNTTNCTNKTFEGTVTLSSKLDFVLLRIHAYADKDISGTISDLYINDEPVKFI